MSGAILEHLATSERDQLVERRPPRWIEPMLATLSHAPFSDPDWIYERKLDGERALAFVRDGAPRLLSRNRKDLGRTYPELVEALAEAAARDCVLDGEVVAFEGGLTSFSRLQERMQIDDAAAARRSGVAVRYSRFDLVHVEGHSLERLPLRRRKALLKRAVDFGDPLRFTPHRNAAGEAFLAEACGKGWEGLIAKRAASPYVHGRSREWMKFKCIRGQELVIGGFTAPRGSRKGFGALLVGYHQGGALRYAGKVGTGFDDAFLGSFRARLDRRARETCPFEPAVRAKDVTWVAPELVGEFGFTEWTRDGKLRHPRFLGLRRDKDPEDVVREEGPEP